MYALKRILRALPVLWGTSTLVFFLIHFIPGDPVDIILGENALPANREQLREQLGLNLPVVTQYKNFMLGLFQFDLGESIYKNRPVIDIILEKLPSTALLAVLAMCFSVALSIPLGILAAIRRGSWTDHLNMIVSLIGLAMPTFWLGPLLVIYFSIGLGWFPVSEFTDWRSCVLPTVTLGVALAAIVTRMTRSAVLEQLDQDFVRTARSKGLTETFVLGKHVLRNALIPVVTIIGLQTGALLSGAIITETVFDWPGVGLLIFQGIQSRDYPLVQGCVLVISTTYILVNLATDIVYGIIDPRIRY